MRSLWLDGDGLVHVVVRTLSAGHVAQLELAWTRLQVGDVVDLQQGTDRRLAYITKTSDDMPTPRHFTACKRTASHIEAQPFVPTCMACLAERQ